MLRIAPFPVDAGHVLPIEIDGAVGKQDFANIVAELENRLAEHDKLSLYVEIHSLGGVSPQALFNDLKAAIKHWDRFDKQAVVTDVSGVAKAADWSDKIMPKTTIRGFSMAERESARQWIIT